MTPMIRRNEVVQATETQFEVYEKLGPLWAASTIPFVPRLVFMNTFKVVTQVHKGRTK